MIIAVVGSGGKTTLVKKLARQYRMEGKKVFVTTTTHMFIEADTLLTDDPAQILDQLERTGYAMAGLPDKDKINPVSRETYDAVCAAADVVLVEADGSRRLPLKIPREDEPVIPHNTERILVVCGLNGVGRRAADVCHRLELVEERLGIDDDTCITAHHVYRMVMEGYVKPLGEKYPHMKIAVVPRHDGSPYQKVVAAMLAAEQDPGLIRREWF